MSMTILELLILILIFIAFNLEDCWDAGESLLTYLINLT